MAGAAKGRRPISAPAILHIRTCRQSSATYRAGTRDLLLSDTVRMHRSLRRAGVRAELHVVEAAPHGGFMGAAPEDHELIQEFRRFCDEIWAG